MLGFFSRGWGNGADISIFRWFITILPTVSFKIQFKCLVCWKVYNPSSWKRSLPSLSKWHLTNLFRALLASHLGLWLFIFQTCFTSLLEVRITSPSPLYAPRHQGSIYSVNICAFALVFFFTWNVLCRWIPQQSFPSSYLAAGYF